MRGGVRAAWCGNETGKRAREFFWFNYIEFTLIGAHAAWRVSVSVYRKRRTISPTISLTTHNLSNPVAKEIQESRDLDLNLWRQRCVC